MLVDWTEQGIRNVKDSPKRLDAAKEMCRKHGAEMTAFYMTMGSHDGVLVLEAPGDEAVAKIALAVGVRGNVRTMTLKAFTEAEFRQIVQTLD
jgi:uncharacterized protein with GYD domain